MNRIPIRLSLLLAIIGLALSVRPCSAKGRKLRNVSQITTQTTLAAGEDLHLTDSVAAIAPGATVAINDADAWLFFDNVRPNDVVRQYASRILIGGKPFAPGTNGRIAIYRHGAVVMAQSDDYGALGATDGKRTASFRCDYYYTNAPGPHVPKDKVKALPLDNAITHIRLARGYMATLACESNGMGYSRVFVADDDDIDIDLPQQLAGKVSFIRVFRWQYPSKKGWVGSTWKSMPDGLKYAFQQADLTRSTWYYNWGATPTIDPANADEKTYNQEFVPEKWGAGGMWDGVYKIQEATHLMGYNEPDHSEQSNVSVEKAIEEWPLMMQTGMRLGSPATTNYTWLYSFMDKCKKLNYRVDYVVVHAYWGGMSASQWYNDLKTIHERTGRPLWIKEWNNGANWTKENWPSTQEQQYAKQLRDLTAIVHMLDTCSFIERYSIYNWVEDKRMIIDKNGKLTPAGQMYADDQPAYFFNRSKEVTPSWTLYEAPALRYDSITADNQVCLSWTDVNGEQVDHYNLNLNGQQLREGVRAKRALVGLNEACPEQGQYQFYVEQVSVDGKQGKNSNVVTLQTTGPAEQGLTLGETLVHQDWHPLLIQTPYTDTPAVLLGLPTYRNKMPLAPLTSQVSPNHFNVGLRAWLYQQAPTFYAPDTLSYMLLPQGSYQWGSIQAEVGMVDKISSNWKKVAFGKAFHTRPVVIASLSASNDTTATVAVRNITNEGFEVRVRHEGRITTHQTDGCVSFLAATPGEATLAGRRLLVGRTDEGAVGANLTGEGHIVYDKPFEDTPYFFAQMQTENDTITSTLRLKSRSKTGVTLFKDREKAVAHENVAGEQVGYLAISKGSATDIKQASAKSNGNTLWYSLSGMPLNKRPHRPGVYIVKQGARAVRVIIR